MSQTVNLGGNIASLTESRDTAKVLKDGNITQAIVHFPPGANGLVDVAVFRNTEQILPQSGFIALDDATPAYALNVPTKIGDDVSAIFKNTDSANAHRVTVQITVS